MTAADYLKEKFPHSHTLPYSTIIELMENYWQHRKELYEKARNSFNSEKWQSEHNIETLRAKFKTDKDKNHQK